MQPLCIGLRSISALLANVYDFCLDVDVLVVNCAAKASLLPELTVSDAVVRSKDGKLWGLWRCLSLAEVARWQRVAGHICFAGTPVVDASTVNSISLAMCQFLGGWRLEKNRIADHGGRVAKLRGTERGEHTICACLSGWEYEQPTWMLSHACTGVPSSLNDLRLLYLRGTASGLDEIGIVFAKVVEEPQRRVDFQSEHPRVRVMSPLEPESWMDGSLFQEMSPNSRLRAALTKLDTITLLIVGMSLAPHT